MWQWLGKLAVKLALYALSHPEQVKAVIESAKTAKRT
jgi:hypothetical protein